MSTFEMDSLRSEPATIWTYGDPNLMDLFSLNRDVAHQFIVEPWQRLEWLDMMMIPIGPLFVLAVFQLSLGLALFLPFRFLGENIWRLWRRSRAYDGPKMRDPAKTWRRRLSIDAPPSLTDTLMNGFKTRGQTKEQNSAFLTKLPLEIRLEIYRLVLGNRYLQIFVRTSSPYKLEGTIRRHAYMECLSYDCPHPIHKDPFADTNYCDLSKDLLNALLVCRQMYREAMPILYSSNTFKFRNHSHLQLFLTSLLPQRVSTIRKITVDITSSSALDALLWKRSDFFYLEGLRELYVYVPLNYWCHDTADLSDLLKVALPRSMGVFEIGVPRDFAVPEGGFQVRGGSEYELSRRGRSYHPTHGL